MPLKKDLKVAPKRDLPHEKLNLLISKSSVDIFMFFSNFNFL